MKTLSTIFVLFLCLNSLSAEDRIISGSVKSDLGIDLFNVILQVKGTDIVSKSDCEGNFTLKAKLGDTLLLSKPNYKASSWIIDSSSDKLLVLQFNYSQIRTTIESNPAFQVLCAGYSSEPLFIIDGTTKISAYYHSIQDELTEENISSLFILKDPDKLDLLGPCAADGAIWITTTCAFQMKE